MGVARRQFLQMATASLLGWQAMSYPQIAQAADLYGNNLSRSTKRKLALLIGINQYDAKGDWLPLNGCVTDVELQQELLVYRFGFKPADIVTLTDRSATKATIAQAFTEHLIAQALPGDLVVVHFSGHGSRLGQNNTLVTVDSGMPGAELIVNDLMDDTLMLWLHAIATDNTICILDTGHNYPGTPVVGNFRIRTRPSRRDWQLSPEELELQQSLKEQIGNRQGLGQEAKSNSKVVAPGLVLRATSNDRLCADAMWPGFSSGVFTYALTQQLWQVTPATSLHVVLSNVNSALESALEQKAFQSQALTTEKQLNSGSEAKQKSLASYSLNLDNLFLSSSSLNKETSNLDGAEGAIMSVSSDHRSGEVWLAGLPIAPLGYYGVGSILAAVDPDSPSDLKSSALVQVRSHYGLTAQVESLPGQSGLQVGQLLQEQVRTLPRNLTLTIALDLELSKIERVDATSAISAMPDMVGVNATEQFADCLFGVQSTSYGLFSVGHIPILGSFGSVGESVGAALRRLQPLLEGLLAAKLIRLTSNQSSSALGLKVTLSAMKSVNSKSVVLASKTTQHANSADKSTQALRSSNVLNNALTIGDRIICQLENFTELPLYVRIFSLDPRGKMMTPHFFTSPYALDSIVPAKQELLIPQTEAPFDWVVSAPQGLFDIQIVVSRAPLTETTKLLELSSRQAASPTGMVAVPNPLQVAQALLGDLHNRDRAIAPANKPADMWVLDVKDWATLGFTYRVA